MPSASIKNLTQSLLILTKTTIILYGGRPRFCDVTEVCTEQTRLLEHSTTATLNYPVFDESFSVEEHIRPSHSHPSKMLPAMRMASTSQERIATSLWQRAGRKSINRYTTRMTVTVRYFWHTYFKHMLDGWLHRITAGSYAFILCSRHWVLRSLRDGRRSCCRSIPAARAPQLVSSPRAWFALDCCWGRLGASSLTVDRLDRCLSGAADLSN